MKSNGSYLVRCVRVEQATLPEQNGIARARLMDEYGFQIATYFVGIWLGETKEARVGSIQ